MKPEAVEFLSKRLNLPPMHVRQLMTLIERAVRQQVREHNGLSHFAEKAMRESNEYAAKFEIKLNWDSGLYPVFVKDDDSVTFPD